MDNEDTLQGADNHTLAANASSLSSFNYRAKSNFTKFKEFQTVILGINIRYRSRFIAPIHFLVLDLLIFSILVSTLPFLLSTVLLCG